MVYVVYSIVCGAQYYLCSYFYLFWHTNQCTFVLILILVHNNIYARALIDSSTQLSVQPYSYWFCCTTPFTLLFKFILVHNSVYSCTHTDSDAQHHLGSNSYWFWHTTLCMFLLSLIPRTQLSVHLYSYWIWCTMLYLLFLVHKSVCTCIDSGAQKCAFECILILKHIIMYVTIHTDHSTQLSVHLYS